MNDAIRQRLIELFDILASKAIEPRTFSLNHHARHVERQRAALCVIARYQSEPLVYEFLKKLDDGSTHETQDATLRRASDDASEVLHFLKAEQTQRSTETSKQRYQRLTAETDPWLENANLTSDSISPRLAPEPELVEVRLDKWGNVK